MRDEAFIELDGVEKVFDVRKKTGFLKRERRQVRAVDSISFRVARGEMSPGTAPARNQLTLADELARTGLTSAPGVTLAAILALLLTGAGLLVVRRRR